MDTVKTEVRAIRRPRGRKSKVMSRARTYLTKANKEDNRGW